MPPSPYLIFTAVHAEANAISRALRASPFAAAASIHVIGIRAVHLPPAMPADYIRGIILAGFAGALDPSLNISDVILDETSDVPWPSHIANVHKGRILTADHLIATPDSKATLRAQTGAMAVDMEGDRVKAFATALGVPWIHLRAISDRSCDAIDPRLLHFLDNRGRPRFGLLARGLTRHPTLIPPLVRIGWHARSAGQSLGQAVITLLATDPFRKTLQIID